MAAIDQLVLYFASDLSAVSLSSDDQAQESKHLFLTLGLPLSLSNEITSFSIVAQFANKKFTTTSKTFRERVTSSQLSDELDEIDSLNDMTIFSK